jgi:3-oxoacyl-[acyl-carrier protein] reductase
VSRSRALVLGGSGLVGGAVVRALAARPLPTVFTYHHGAERAQALSAETGVAPVRVDLRENAAVRHLVGELERAGQLPDVLFQCAAVGRAASLADLTEDDLEVACAVQCRSALLFCQLLLPHFREAGGGDVVLCGALDRGQSLPMPVPFAAAQGMLVGMAGALARELAPSSVRVNVLLLGPLEGGLSRLLSPPHLADFERMSALRRRGTAAEAARAALWLALDSHYLTGQVVPVNGGL